VDTEVAVVVEAEDAEAERVEAEASGTVETEAEESGAGVGWGAGEADIEAEEVVVLVGGLASVAVGGRGELASILSLAVAAGAAGEAAAVSTVGESMITAGGIATSFPATSTNNSFTSFFTSRVTESMAGLGLGPDKAIVETLTLEAGLDEEEAGLGGTKGEIVGL
jgi:hypothetical protein